MLSRGATRKMLPRVKQPLIGVLVLSTLWQPAALTPCGKQVTSLEDMRRSSVSFRRSPVSSRRPSVSSRRLSVSLRRSSVSLRRSSVSLRRPSVSLRRSSVSLRRPLVSLRRPLVYFGRSSVCFGRPSLFFSRSSVFFRRPSLFLKRSSVLFRGTTYLRGSVPSSSRTKKLFPACAWAWNISRIKRLSTRAARCDVGVGSSAARNCYALTAFFRPRRFAGAREMRP
jgi:hypothetical protein